MENNLQVSFGNEVLKLISPLLSAAGSADARRDLFLHLGWDFKNVDGFPISELNNILSSIEDIHSAITSLLENGIEGLDDLDNLLDLIAEFNSAIESIGLLTDEEIWATVSESFKVQFEKLPIELVDWIYRSA